MGFAWSHTTYAEWRGIIFNFEWKRDLEYFLAHARGSKRISAVEAWNIYHVTRIDFVRVYCSCSLGANEHRKRKVQKWYENRRNLL